MLGLPLAFTVPAVLLCLLGLPVLYYLLRITPPRPEQVPFPPLKLILDLKPKDETPVRTTWWLLLLRLALAALLILAMAGPIWNPRHILTPGRGPLLVLLDDGWPAAPDWATRMTTASDQIGAAGAENRLTALALTSDGARDIAPDDSAKLVEQLRARKPQPFVPDRMATLGAVQKFLSAHSDANIVWICDDLDVGGGRAFAAALAAASPHVTVLTGRHADLAIASTENAAAGLTAHLLRRDTGGVQSGKLVALDLKGLSLGEAPFDFGTATETQAHFDLPIELRNEVSRVAIRDEHSAGAVSLLDSRSKRRRVGIVTGTSADEAQPLLNPAYYLTKALSPFAEVRQAHGDEDPIISLLDENVSVLVLADVGVTSQAAHDRLVKFIEDGGILLRFAGSRLAAADDDLIPVTLRRGGRILGGSLSWDKPKQLQTFDKDSPFFGLPVPADVTVSRQVLAEPEPGLVGKTWAALSDGTPLVTEVSRGKGVIALVHVTADTGWSNLPLSGLFVDMLRRIVDLAGTTAVAPDDPAKATAAGVQKDTGALAPHLILDGFGVLGAPPVTAQSIHANDTNVASLDHPPGFYGPTAALIAVNPLQPNDTLKPLDLSNLSLTRNSFEEDHPIDAKPWLLLVAALLALADALASFWLSGAFRGRLRTAASALALIAILALPQAFPHPAQAQTQAQTAPGQQNLPAVPPRDMDAALQTRLAYVVTGDPQVDEISRQGLTTLSWVLQQRTSITPGDPMSVDPAHDDLAFYPIIYWPIVAGRPQPSQEAITHIADYMKRGGTVIFDTRDALTARRDGPPTPEALWLRQLLSGVDVPELEPVPKNHVATRTFYLIDSFVGRYSNGETWLEALPPETPDEANRPARAGDSVSPILITQNDLASAWAIDRMGQPLVPLTPGAPAMQREMALRGGVNLVMYALTGNYKADQVHAKALIERLAR
ncbi:DUF4159 domain-containing protein [Methylovirgula sp. 4M-Z18]|uniref:DUF4159 domain-containing protein n=1 Tax=Methylovirgula sp. 4M-Z18 TaxID=2293567 RepID=UPI000E2F77E1|nr:DUF4159 domain-containing protein [Methylovirgula sp. 4M-Z18]RFB79291.1 DUF4159 domain-containing protein [Methylovirgula sp. 4M-Z18]